MSDYHRVLFVDDDKDTCQMLGLMLKMADDACAVKSVNTAQEALGLLETQTFDLYVLDYRMPDMTGVELCSRIRQTDKQVPILFFSAMARNSDRKSATMAGANDYLVKPNDLDRFAETVKQLLHENSSIKVETPGGFGSRKSVY